jgi:uncharacterized membrane protein YoaT (DUF817 family)
MGYIERSLSIGMAYVVSLDFTKQVILAILFSAIFIFLNLKRKQKFSLVNSLVLITFFCYIVELISVTFFPFYIPLTEEMKKLLSQKSTQLPLNLT